MQNQMQEDKKYFIKVTEKHFNQAINGYRPEEHNYNAYAIVENFNTDDPEYFIREDLQ